MTAMSDNGDVPAAMVELIDQLAREADQEARTIILEGLTQADLAPPTEDEWSLLDAGIKAGYAGAVVVLSRHRMLSLPADMLTEPTQRPEMKGTTP